jgi:hypothetical protein
MQGKVENNAHNALDVRVGVLDEPRQLNEVLWVVHLCSHLARGQPAQRYYMAGALWPQKQESVGG